MNCDKCGNAEMLDAVVECDKHKETGLKLFHRAYVCNKAGCNNVILECDLAKSKAGIALREA